MTIAHNFLHAPWCSPEHHDYADTAEQWCKSEIHTLDVADSQPMARGGGARRPALPRRAGVVLPVGHARDGATVAQVAAGMGLDVAEVVFGLLSWADGQHRET